ncbi:MAG TPA: hypothetical protein VHW26_01765 [Solirubrobacteraceae bacterium]|jgi:hypothetical protein|nr:hypothetical protein [Solirubrobacteraceae bacterium]
MKTLLLTNAPIDANQLRDVVGSEGLDDEVVVVAPALHASALRFWISDADQAISRADWVQHETVDNLGDADVDVTGDTGESDPGKAIEDVLRTFDADRVVVFTRPGKSLYREDVDAGELQRRFGIPVELAPTGSSR